MALHERKNQDDWETKGRFYYRTVGKDGRPRTYQVSKTLEREFIERGIEPGHSFRSSQIYAYLQDELFFTLNEGNQASVRLRDLPVGMPRYADDAPHFFHVRLRLISDFERVEGTATAEVVEAPDSVLVVAEDVEPSSELDVLFDDDGEFSSIPKRLTVWFESRDGLPSEREFVRIALSRHPETDAIFACRRPFPRRNETLRDREGTEYTVRELTYPTFKLISQSGLIETVQWTDLVGDEERLAASLADGFGRKLEWRVERKSPLDDRIVRGISQWRYDFELDERLYVKTRLPKQEQPVQRFALTSLSLKSLPAAKSFVDHVTATNTDDENSTFAFGLLTTGAGSEFSDRVLFRSKNEMFEEVLGNNSVKDPEGVGELATALSLEDSQHGYTRSSIELSIRLRLAREREAGVVVLTESITEFVRERLSCSEDFEVWVGIPPEEETVLRELLIEVGEALDRTGWTIQTFALNDERAAIERQVAPFGEFSLTPV